MESKILTMIIICLVLLSFSINVFSNNEMTNSQANNVTNSELNTIGNVEENNMTLQEQKNEIDNKLNESNIRLEYVQSEISASLQKVQELNDSIAEYEKKYSDIQNQINSLEQEIANTNAELGTIEAEYERKDKLLKKRVVAMYEDGDATYLDVLLSSRSLIEFLSNYYMLEQIIELDNNMLDELEKQKNTIEKKKAEQEQKKIDLRVAKAKEGQMQILMQNQKMLQENYAAKLTNEEKELHDKIEAYKAEQAEIERLIQAAIQWSGNLAIQYKGGVMIWPVGIEGTYITSSYGNRLHPVQGVNRYHDGIDIGNAGFGAPVVAAADGFVTYAGVMGGYGNCVMINHGDGIITLYGHGQEIKTTLGASVKQGDVIMAVGSTGVSTGPHLHFEVRKYGVPVDPIPYLSGKEDSDKNTNSTENNNNGTDINASTKEGMNLE